MIVRVYASRADSAVERPAAGWPDLPPWMLAREETTVDMTILARAFAHWDNGSHNWQTEPGTVHLAVGRSYRELPLQAKITVPG